jgi:hypothetical protein
MKNTADQTKDTLVVIKDILDRAFTMDLPVSEKTSNYILASNAIKYFVISLDRQYYIFPNHVFHRQGFKLYPVLSDKDYNTLLTQFWLTCLQPYLLERPDGVSMGTVRQLEENGIISRTRESTYYTPNSEAQLVLFTNKKGASIAVLAICDKFLMPGIILAPKASSFRELNFGDVDSFLFNLTDEELE